MSARDSDEYMVADVRGEAAGSDPAGSSTVESFATESRAMGSWATGSGLVRSGVTVSGVTGPELQPPSASDVFLHGLTSEVNTNDVNRMVDTQRYMLSRFEKTNEMLLNFNQLSTSRYESTQIEFRRHINMLLETKKDLDLVFKRIRLLKTKLSTNYPDAFKACTHIYEVSDDEEETDQQQTRQHTTATNKTTVIATAAAQGRSVSPATTATHSAVPATTTTFTTTTTTIASEALSAPAASGGALQTRTISNKSLTHEST